LRVGRFPIILKLKTSSSRYFLRGAGPCQRSKFRFAGASVSLPFPIEARWLVYHPLAK
jgi:hypothetical protein